MTSQAQEHSYRRVQARQSDSQRLPHRQSADVRRHPRPRSRTGEMPEKIEDQCANMFGAYEGDRGSRRRQHRRHHQDDGLAARIAAARAGQCRVAEDVSRRAFAPSPSCAAMDMEGGALVQCDFTAVIGRLKEQQTARPIFRLIRTRARHPASRRRRASTVSSMCLVPWNTIPSGPAPPIRCRRRPGRLRFGYTRRLVSSAASSCRRRHMAPIIRWCWTGWRRWGRTTRPARMRWFSPKRDDAYLAKLNDAGVRGARFSFRKELGAVLSDSDYERAIARISRTRLVR